MPKKKVELPDNNVNNINYFGLSANDAIRLINAKYLTHNEWKEVVSNIKYLLKHALFEPHEHDSIKKAIHNIDKSLKVTGWVGLKIPKSIGNNYRSLIKDELASLMNNEKFQTDPNYVKIYTLMKNPYTITMPRIWSLQKQISADMKVGRFESVIEQLLNLHEIGL